MKHYRKAFTLVELLVVIGIIAVLVSILLPALNKARQAANVVACGSNMRQIGQAMAMYAGENHGTLPWGAWKWLSTNPATYPHPTDYTGLFAVSWDDLISPYLGQRFSTDQQLDAYYNATVTGSAGGATNVLRCPADQVDPPNGFPRGFRRTYAMVSDGIPRPVPTSLSYNAQETFGVSWSQQYPSPSDTNPPYCDKLARIHDPSGTILIAEQPYNGVGLVGGTNGTVPSPTKQITYGGILTAGAAIHGGLKAQTLTSPAGTFFYANFNYLYCDGHVDFISGLASAGSGNVSSPRGGWTSILGD